MPIPNLIRARLWLATALLWVADGHATNRLGFPDEVAVPPQLVVDPDQTLIHETLGEAPFESDAEGSSTQTVQGEHWARWLRWQPGPGEPAPGYDNGTEERIIGALQQGLTKAGWQRTWQIDNQSAAVWQRQGAWLRMHMDAPQAQVHLELIVPGSAANALVHTPPAAQPESFGNDAPFPYLTPYPGSTFRNSGRGEGPLDITPAFAAGDEAPVAGQSVLLRSYQGPTTLSKLQFVRDNVEALRRAGWQVLYPTTDADAGSVIAHYQKDGRELWARLDYEFGAALSYSVADVGGDDWAARLRRDCSLPLYGVRFDFNLAMLRPESEPVLARAAAVLKAQRRLAVEVQGHTDNVGTEDYNLKLSGARASEVVQWLSAHGVAVTRLRAHAYGESQPIADNDTDYGRARNRRVVLHLPDCRKR